MKIQGVTLYLVALLIAILLYIVLALFQSVISEPIYNKPQELEKSGVPPSLGINFNTTITALVLPTEENTIPPKKGYQLTEFEPEPITEKSVWQKLVDWLFGD